MYGYDRIRESIVAGSFYSADPYVLKMQIEDYLLNAEDFAIKNIKALICPHAGYIYSGQVAGYSYKQVAKNSYDCVIVVSPSHAEYFDFISIFNGDGYSTPLGNVMIDKERAELLKAASPEILFSDKGHNEEHSIEVQLPFLQTIFNENLKFIPIAIGVQSKKNINNLGKALGETFKDHNVLIVASTDLSHYHTYSDALLLDREVIKYVQRYDIEQLEEEYFGEKVEMCGGGPVISAMIAAKEMGADSAYVLKYQNSGDISGEKKAVVGYLSAAFFSKNK